MSILRGSWRYFSGDTEQVVRLQPKPAASDHRYLSVVAIFRDEAPYLTEWLEFHRLVGVEHVYLYDNGSIDDSLRILAPYIREGFVTTIPWAFPWHTAAVSAQQLAFAHALANYGPGWRWIAFIDIDEFLYPVTEESVATVLRSFEDLPAIAVFWAMFGSSGHIASPKGLLIESFIWRAPFPMHAKPKSIVDPSKVVGVLGAHLFDLTTGESMAFTEKRAVVRRSSPLRREPEDEKLQGDAGSVLRLNHYYTRSKDDLQSKIEKAHREKRSERAQKIARLANMVEAQSVEDRTILRFASALRARLQPAKVPKTSTPANSLGG